jgi:hypothetical protein
MVAAQPLDEQLRGQLMLALYRSGRATDALAAYHQLRRALDEELGMYPGQDLRSLETAILQQDPDLDAPARPAPAAPPRPTPPPRVPAQLPPAVRAFTGRETELKSLDTLLPEPAAAGGRVTGRGESNSTVAFDPSPTWPNSLSPQAKALGGASAAACGAAASAAAVPPTRTAAATAVMARRPRTRLLPLILSTIPSRGPPPPAGGCGPRAP